MKITPINYNYNTQKYKSKASNPSFGEWERVVCRSTKLYNYKNHTTFFRNDLFWNGLTYFLTEHFKNTKKVNVYSFGCSDGSEPYTFIMRMLNSFEKNPKKFFPIIARDFDSEAIQRAKRNNYFLTNGEEFLINKYTDGQIKKYFNDEYHGNYSAKEILYDNVDFAVGDILKDYKKINPKNTLILARNFWPYVDQQYSLSNFWKKLYNHLEPGCVVAIGQFDEDQVDMSSILRKTGFKNSPYDLIYYK